MPKLTKEEEGTVINVTFQLIGEEAALLKAYSRQQFIRTLSTAARKGLLEYLSSLKGKGKLHAEEANGVEAQAA